MPDARGAHVALFSTSLQRATRGQQVPASQLMQIWRERCHDGLFDRWAIVASPQ